MDPYDPDMFDWEEDAPPGIPISALPEGTIEMAIDAALQATDAAFGWHWAKKEKLVDQAKKIFKHKTIVPSEEQREWIRAEWPEYHHVFSDASRHHDHPVAHITTELNEIEMVAPLVAEGNTWIDLFGNSQRDTKYRRKAINVYGLKTPKDYLRYQHIDNKDVLYNIDEICDPTSRLGRLNDITCTHALYYVPMEDIGRMMHTSRNRRLRALVHRHPESSGTMSFGEIKYSVDETGWVRQTNVVTGEMYEHPSLEALFHQSSAATAAGGVAWTTRKMGGDTFLIEFVGCPKELCKAFVPLHKIQPASRVQVTSGTVSIHRFLHWTWTKTDSVNGSVHLYDTDLLSKLRRYVSGKSRTPRLKTELANLARRLTNKADIISIHGGGAHEVDICQLQDYVNAAFYMDVAHELEVALAFHKKNAEMVKMLNSFYDDGKMPNDISIATKVASYVKQVVVEVPEDVLSGFGAHLGLDVDPNKVEYYAREPSKPPWVPSVWSAYS